MHALVSLSTLLLLLSLSLRATALGINCRGSSECGTVAMSWEDDFNLPADTYDALAYGNASVILGGPLNNDTTFAYGEHIVCRPRKTKPGGICLFAQHNTTSPTVTAAKIIEGVGNINKHNCHVCGSWPLSGDNDPNKQGILTFNYVLHPACEGVCRW